MLVYQRVHLVYLSDIYISELTVSMAIFKGYVTNYQRVLKMKKTKGEILLEMLWHGGFSCISL